MALGLVLDDDGNELGYHRTCPFCGCRYKPTHPDKATAMTTQDIESREQWISGCCSTECWNILFPPDEEEQEDPHGRGNQPTEEQMQKDFDAVVTFIRSAFPTKPEDVKQVPPGEDDMEVPQ